MGKVLSKMAGDLIDLLKTRGVNQDSCIGTMLMLKTEKNYKKMLQWIKKNPSAGQTEILRHLRATFMTETPNSASTQTKKPISARIKKIAMF